MTDIELPTPLPGKELTVQQVEALVAEVFTIRHDDDTAHGLEDSIHQHVLYAIASGAADPVALAAAALRTREIDFGRYTA